MATQTPSDLHLTAEALWQQLHTACIDRIEAYHNDPIVHDKQWIMEHPKVSFVHATSKMGTHMISMSPLSEYPPRGEWVPFLFGTADRDHILRSTTVMVLGVEKLEQEIQWLYFDGSRLWPSDAKQAERVAERYITLVERVWAIKHPSNGEPMKEEPTCTTKGQHHEDPSQSQRFVEDHETGCVRDPIADYDPTTRAHTARNSATLAEAWASVRSSAMAAK